jgi:type IV secretory pathway TraG/TraD family ATPase VirD4
VSLFWEFQRAGFAAAAGTAKVTAKAVRGAVRAGQYSRQAAAQRRLTGLASAGVLAPGDGPAPPGVNVLDYRGLAPTNTVQRLPSGLPLGYLLDTRRGAVGPMYLPVDTIFRHACVIGPPGSGKTYSVITPWIVALLQHGFSVATIDIKGDLIQEIQAYGADLGMGPLGVSAKLFDYAAQRTHRWNFLREITSDQSLEAAVQSLLGRQKDNDPQPFFYQRDYRWLKGLIKMTVEMRQAAAEPRHILDLLVDPGLVSQVLPGSAARAELHDFVGLDPADFSQATSGLMNTLALFSDPTVARSVATSDFSLDAVLRRPTLLIGVARLSDGRRAEQMSSLLLSQLSMTVLNRFGGGTPHPAALIVDEAPRLKERLNFEEFLSVARGAQVGVCLAAQDVSGFGTDQQQAAVLSNCHTFVSMHGVSPSTADYLSRRLGQRKREDYSVTHNPRRGLFEPPSRTVHVTDAPVLGPTEIMFPAYGDRSAIVHCPTVARGPFMVDLTRGVP